MKIYYVLPLVLFLNSHLLISQESLIKDRNTNQGISFAKYLDKVDEYMSSQNTSQSETHKAIYPTKGKKIFQQQKFRLQKRSEQVRNTKFIEQNYLYEHFSRSNKYDWLGKSAIHLVQFGARLFR